jgi:flagellar motor component MotA
MMLLIIGFLFMVFILAVVGALSGMLMMFIDLPSILLILVPLLFFVFTSKSGNILSMYIKTSFKKNYSYAEAELAALSGAIKNTIKFILAAGGFGFASGLLACLVNLDNKEMLGPSLALSLLAFLYAIAVSAFIFLPTQAWAENKINLLRQK